VSLAILHVYRHNSWATHALLGFLESQPPEVLAATTPGSFGTVAQTLVHLVAAQERYVERLAAAKRAEPVRESGGWRGFQPLRESLDWSDPRLLAAAGTAPENAELETDRNGELVTLKLATLLAQAINHATEHRVNITTTLAALEIEHPELDVWAYAEATWP
jgi:uncharacterized damage-inducible protein DinB